MALTLTQETISQCVKKAYQHDVLVEAKRLYDLISQRYDENLKLKERIKELEDKNQKLESKLDDTQRKLSDLTESPAAHLVKAIDDYITAEVKNKLQVDVNMDSDYYSSYPTATVNWM